MLWCEAWRTSRILRYTRLAKGTLGYSQSPGEIKKSEVSWTLTQKLDSFAGPGETKMREVVLDPQVQTRRDQERGGGAGLRKLDFVCFGCFSAAMLQTLSL